MYPAHLLVNARRLPGTYPARDKVGVWPNSASTRQSLQIKYSTACASDAVTTRAGACTPHPAATMVGAGATGAGAVIPPVIPSGEAREGLPWELCASLTADYCHGRARHQRGT